MLFFLYNVTDGSYPEIICSDVVIMLSVNNIKTINYLKILFYDKILIMLLESERLLKKNQSKYHIQRVLKSKREKNEFC